ncbi:WecB/TagA/CpsF family glycosyltransferase [Phenylobacterium sp.]|uniref:WecB/TagA/CpsF family glycosyltransferase n=1 Tax=Phenylobacterium sp. TaxID=1871053 RepID=UPI0027314250|nr:WecB/TagA/CpsF family glycosyltransferase [Phenylobacterium sp.]MDP2213500.1 WecB/TagA/CpsF family glycosyltransferase [Phenylobacterium sp.]
MDLVRPEEVMAELDQQVAAGRSYLVANHNLHSLYLLPRHGELADFFASADLIEIDSTPLIAFARLLGLPARPFHRCTYLDWRDHFWSLADRRGWRVFYLGGAPGVAQIAAGRISRLYPGATIAVADGYFDAAEASEDNRTVLEQVRAFGPHILMVGMGMPRQEQWILRNRAALPPCVILPVGAAFDYEADAQKAAPRWMGRAGLEWLFRLTADPKRLWRRYCLEPWFLVGPALRDIGDAIAQRRFMARRSSGRRPVSEPVPVQGGLDLGEDGAQPALPAELQEDLIVQGPETRLVDRQEA